MDRQNGDSYPYFIYEVSETKISLKKKLSKFTQLLHNEDRVQSEAF